MAGGISVSGNKAWMVGTAPVLHLSEELKDEPGIKANIDLKTVIDRAEGD